MEYKLNEIRENATLLNAGRHRTVYLTENGEVLKVANIGYENDNNTEVELYSRYKDVAPFLNRCESASHNNTIIKTNYCISLSTFFEMIGLKITRSKLFNSTFTELIEEFKELENYLDDTWNNIKEFFKNLGMDISEIDYPYNLSYDPMSNKIKIIDYAE